MLPHIRVPETLQDVFTWNQNTQEVKKKHVFYLDRTEHCANVRRNMLLTRKRIDSYLTTTTKHDENMRSHLTETVALLSRRLSSGVTCVCICEKNTQRSLREPAWPGSKALAR